MSPSAVEFLPAKRSIRSLRAAAAECRGCDLYRHATQTVFGEGRLHVVALGTSAAQSMLGASFRFTHHRGEVFDVPPSGQVAATLHPSAILRCPKRTSATAN